MNKKGNIFFNLNNITRALENELKNIMMKVIEPKQ